MGGGDPEDGRMGRGRHRERKQLVSSQEGNGKYNRNIFAGKEDGKME